MNEQLEALLKEVKSLTNTVGAQATALEAASAFITEAKGRIEALEKAVSSQTEAAKADAGKISVLEKELGEAKAKADGLEKELGEAKAQIKDADTRTLVALGKLGFRAQDGKQEEKADDQPAKPGLSAYAKASEEQALAALGKRINPGAN